MRRVFLLAALTGLVAPVLEAQSSQFGVRGLGIPLRPYSPRSLAAGGAIALFDPESSTNPAALASITQFTSMFSTTQNFRTSTNPFGTESGRDNRFPQILAAGPVGGTPFGVSVSLSGYTDRSYTLGTVTRVELRGQPVDVYDTLSSRGGLSDIRIGTGWQVTNWFQVGLGLHAITGLNRVENRQAYSDSSYTPAGERTDLSYLGAGASVGATLRVHPSIAFAGVYRNDGHLRVDRDSTPMSRIDLPVSWALSGRWQPTMRFTWAATYQQKQWSASRADILAQGGIGAENTYEMSTGIEWLRDTRNPQHRAIRLGGHYATLPFPLLTGRQAHEYGISLGTGVRFTQARGGLDLAVQQLWRSDGGSYTERATVVTLGVSIRP